MEKKILLICLLFAINISSVKAQKFDGVMGLIERIAPWAVDKVEIHKINTKNKERFEIYTKKNKLFINATSISAASQGFNYYLKHYCFQMVSHCGNNLRSMNKLPAVDHKIIIETPFQYRYALNYCTYNYSMSFYNWSDWENELDWMALNGVNLMLAINGTEIIWQKTLNEFGFSNTEIKNFIPGPAFTAWWLMGNLEGYGGPITDNAIVRQMNLQKRILKRMRALGIEPILQGFYGMVPTTLKKKYPHANIIEQGKWCGFQRPAFLSPQDTLFSKLAKSYYLNIRSVYGDVKYFGGDPFHEGGKSDSIDITLSGKNIQEQMMKYFPNSTWILQGWTVNPQKELLNGLIKENILIVNLKGESLNTWEQTKSFDNSPWIWCIINNFGETSGMSGTLQHILDEPRRALKTNQGKFMKGVGIAPEGILNNPLLYELSINNAWGDKSIYIDSLLYEYMLYRYGKYNNEIFKGLLLLKKSVYSKHSDGSPESIFAARPSKNIKSTSSWGSRKINYDVNSLEFALKAYENAVSIFHKSQTFQFDITDMGRQVLANRGQMTYDSIMKYFEKKDIVKYQQFKDEFIFLLNLQEQLMSTNRKFMVGTWLKKAMCFGVTNYERKLYNENARLQITIWGPDSNPETELHDYAFKEWSGLIVDLYSKRWKLFFDELDMELAGKIFKELDYFSTELNWVKQQQKYSTKPVGNYVELIRKINIYLANKNLK
ncbi:MAG: alpha-N-acetylglucosaminidase [Paludibacter sp.]|nr:alpha-N-acetylglucosaminidase [Paludibacter sp.]